MQRRWFCEDYFECPTKTLADKMDFIERRLGTIGAVRGLGYTHSTKSMSEGPQLSAYKTLETMIDKMNGQLSLGHRLRGVDVRTVASVLFVTLFTRLKG